MKFLLLIVFLVISFMPTLLVRAKRQAAGRTGSDAKESDWEQNENFFDFDEPEAKPASQSATQPSYFTYEAPQAEEEKPVETPVQTAAFVEEPARPAFDLRQAVIYQTLLTNNYTNYGN